MYSLYLSRLEPLHTVLEPAAWLQAQLTAHIAAHKSHALGSALGPRAPLATTRVLAAWPCSRIATAACIAVHTPTLVPPHDIHHGSPSPAACAILSTPQHGHDASHFACAHALTLTGRQSARAFWPVRLSTQVCSLFSRLCSGSRLLGSRLLRSRVVALLSARASARPEWLCFSSGLARHATSGSA